MKYVLVTCVCVLAAGSTDVLADESHFKLIGDAEAIAAEYRDLTDDPDAKSQLKAKVKALVQQSFDSRQATQRKQIQEMREKLRQAESTLENRETIKDRIIDRKVEDLLSGQAADWKSTPTPDVQLFDVIGIGDTVAIYLEGVVPMNLPKQLPALPQVNILKSGRIVTGFPFVVGSDGAITLPMLGTIEITGLTVSEAKKKISDAYTDRDILRPEKSMPTLTLVPKEDALFSVIDAAGVAGVPEPTAAATIQTVASGVSSFEDTYGRLNKARELAADIRAKQEAIDGWKRSIEKGVRANDKTPYSKIILELEKKVSTAIFRLELERDYIADVIKQLATDLRSKESLLKKAKGKLAATDELYKTGAATFSSRSEVESQMEQASAEVENAMLKYSQYEKIAKRWNGIVGDILDEDADLKQRVDERGGR